MGGEKEMGEMGERKRCKVGERKSKVVESRRRARREGTKAKVQKDIHMVSSSIFHQYLGQLGHLQTTSSFTHLNTHKKRNTHFSLKFS